MERKRKPTGGNPNGSDGNNNQSKKRKRSPKLYGPNVPRVGERSLAELRSAKGGLIVSCVRGKEKITGRKLKEWLLEITDDEDSTANISSGDIMKALASEVAAHKKNRDSLVSLLNIPNGKALVALKFEEEFAHDPVDLTRKLIEYGREHGPSRIPGCHKCDPMQACCFPKIDEILETAKPLITEHFKDETMKDQTCAIVVRRRYCDDLDKMEIINKLATLMNSVLSDMWKTTLKVNLKNPDVVFLVEIIQNVAGIAIIRDYQSLNDLNFHTAYDAAQE